MRRKAADRTPDDDDPARLHERGTLHRVERGDGAAEYAIDSPFVAAPPLPGEAVAGLDLDTVIDALAADVVVQAASCVRKFGDFHLALSGDPLLEPVYERLMYDPNCRGLPWQRTHLWIVDERQVAFDHPLSAFRLVRETIVDHSDIPPEQVHPIFPLGDSPADAYAEQIRSVLAWREKGQDRLDMALLAAGPEGSIAGLLPGSPALADASRLVAVVPATAPAVPGRVTMTFGLLNATRFLAVLATGRGRAAPIRRVVEGHEPFEALPLKGLRPLGGTLKWYLDAAAVA